MRPRILHHERRHPFFAARLKHFAFVRRRHLHGKIWFQPARKERIVQVSVVELIFAAAVHAVGRHRQPAPDLALEAEADALRLRRLRMLGDDGLAGRDGTERTARERIGIARILNHDRVGILSGGDVELHVQKRSIDIQPVPAADGGPRVLERRPHKADPRLHIVVIVGHAVDLPVRRFHVIPQSEVQREPAAGAP